MRQRFVFCSARDRLVRVLLPETFPESGQASFLDTEVCCLEIGLGCTGNMCPLCGVKPGAGEAPGLTN